jgi:hypothetical protein
MLDGVSANSARLPLEMVAPSMVDWFSAAVP